MPKCPQDSSDLSDEASCPVIDDYRSMIKNAVCIITLHKISAVAEMGDRLAIIDMGRKLEGLMCPFLGELTSNNVACAKAYRLLDNSRIRQLADCQLADWTSRGLYKKSRMPSATLHA